MGTLAWFVIALLFLDKDGLGTLTALALAIWVVAS